MTIPDSTGSPAIFMIDEVQPYADAAALAALAGLDAATALAAFRAALYRMAEITVREIGQALVSDTLTVRAADELERAVSAAELLRVNLQFYARVLDEEAEARLLADLDAADPQYGVRHRLTHALHRRAEANVSDAERARRAEAVAVIVNAGRSALRPGGAV